MNDITARVEADEASHARKGAPHEKVGDTRFIAQLEQLRILKQFLFEEKVISFHEKNGSKDDQLDGIDLGDLNNISYAKNGPNPYNSEWRLLDEKMSSLTSYLTDDLKRKIRIRELGTYFGKWPLVFLIASICTSILEIILHQHQLLEPQQIEGSSLLYYLSYFLILMFWCISQGGLGACAFLGTSAIVKVSVDGGQLGVNKTSELLDVTDRNVLKIRILLGALFGFLLGGSFAQKAFTVGNEMFFNHSPPTVPDIAIILIPFVCGFSTNLVLVVLNRFVVAIETFFGLPGRT